MKADRPPDPPSTISNSSTNTKSQQSNNKGNTSLSAATASAKNEIATNPSVTLAPQKLNRKQRRKLQQQQQNTQDNNQGKNSNSTTYTDKSSYAPSKTTTDNNSDITTTPAAKPAVINGEQSIKTHGDGLLPTPPASYRLMQNSTTDSNVPPTTDNTNQTKTVIGSGRNTGNTDLALGGGTGNNTSAVNQKVIRKPVPIGQEAKQQQNQQQEIKLPIGSSRLTTTSPNMVNSLSHITQQQMQHIQQQPILQSSTNSGNINLGIGNKQQPLSNVDLQPPANPVLMAQMHLQKLGLEEPPSSFLALSMPSSSAPPQTVTNSYIQQYLRQMNSANKSSLDLTNNTSSASVASMSSPLLATSLSSLLPQPPVPANSLSDGPQKSKLLQWTQPSATIVSASNSLPASPPSVDDEKEQNNLPPRKVDPVSAKWGVIAAPRLSPTPAEFKPGVPWRPRGVSQSDKDDEDEEESFLVTKQHVEIPQSSFAAKLMEQQRQQQQQDLEMQASSAHDMASQQQDEASDYTWVLLKGFPLGVRVEVFLF